MLHRPQLMPLGPVVGWDPVNREHPWCWGMVSWWKALRETSRGAFFYDLLSNYHLTLNNGTAWATPVPSGEDALSFDGSNDYCTIADNPVHRPSLISVGISIAPVSVTNYLFPVFIDKGTVNLCWLMLFGAVGGGDGTAGFRCVNTLLSIGTAADPTPMSTGIWTRLLGTWDGTTVTLYRNGLSVATAALSGTLNQNTGAGLFLGDYSSGTGTNNYAGRMDSVAIWSRPLSAAEARMDYELWRQDYPGVLNRGYLRARGAVAASGTTYPQLERGIRGLNRGLFTGRAAA